MPTASPHRVSGLIPWSRARSPASSNAPAHHLARLIPWTCLLLAGCAGPGPRLFPIAPLRESRDEHGRLLRLYDRDGDGHADCGEVLGDDGRVRMFLPSAASGEPIEYEPSRASRDLLIILDSVPFEMVREAWNAGRFRAFHPPSRLVSVFPAMTDPALAEFFGVSPCKGVESVYYDGRSLVRGFDSYIEGANAPWLSQTNYHLRASDHAWAYLWPGPWFRFELGEIQRAFDGGTTPRYVAYCVGTSALGSKRGRDGHQEALLAVDRLCQAILHESRGAVRITLLSDHGHTLAHGRRIDLPRALRRCGYNPTSSLAGVADVVVPAFGLVSCAAVYTLQPAAVARDLVGLDGVELACFVERRPHDPALGADTMPGDRVVVLSRDGEAQIRHGPGGFHYATIRGDPLRLGPILERLRAAGGVDAAGVIDDRALLDATADHEFPDPLHRLWRAFHGLFEHTPDVLLSLADGYYTGSADLSQWLDMQAAHGSLRRASTSGFIMTTAGPLPPNLRMQDARATLEAAK